MVCFTDHMVTVILIVFLRLGVCVCCVYRGNLDPGVDCAIQVVLQL